LSVVVESNGGNPPLDEETILFLEDKVVLGKVSEFFLTRFSTLSHCCHVGWYRDSEDNVSEENSLMFSH